MAIRFNHQRRFLRQARSGWGVQTFISSFFWQTFPVESVSPVTLDLTDVNSFTSVLFSGWLMFVRLVSVTTSELLLLFQQTFSDRVSPVTLDIKLTLSPQSCSAVVDWCLLDLFYDELLLFERFTAEDSGGHPVNIYTLTQRRRTACQWGIFYIFFLTGILSLSLSSLLMLLRPRHVTSTRRLKFGGFISISICGGQGGCC